MFSCCFFVLFNLQSQWKSRGEQRQFLCLPRSAHKARPTALSAEAERRQTSISIHYNREAFISFIKKTKRNETKRRRRRNEGECICVCESEFAATERARSRRKSWAQVWDTFASERERERNLHGERICGERICICMGAMWNMPFIYFVFHRYYAP